MNARAANAYRRVDLESAPKTQIVERLFERCVRDIADARAAIEARDIQRKAFAIDHALQIVVELKASLDVAAAPELCANLAALYDFVAQRLIDANAALSLPPLDQATRVMAELGDAFRSAHASGAHLK
jgi:flagellar protein FliS